MRIFLITLCILHLHAADESFEPEFITVSVVLGDRGGERTNVGSIQIFSDGESRIYPEDETLRMVNGPKISEEQYLAILSAGFELNRYLMDNYNSEVIGKMNGTLHFDLHRDGVNVSVATSQSCAPAHNLIAVVNAIYPGRCVSKLTYE